MRGEKTKELWRNPAYRKMMSDAHKGKPPPNKGKKGIWKHSEETKKRMSEKRKGHPFYGFRKLPEKIKQKIGNSVRKYWKEHKEERKVLNSKISQSLKGRRLSKSHRQRLSDSHKGKKQPEWLVKKRIKASVEGLSRRPTKPEKEVMRIVKKHNLPFRYNGNNAGLMIGTKIPDFISNNANRQVIEVFGRRFHDPNYRWALSVQKNRTYDATLDYYKKRGYDCFIFWEDEITEKDVLSRLIR